MNTTAEDVRVRNLIQAAEAAAAAGQDSESGRLLAEARAAAPNHPLVLNEEGRLALNRGEFPAARELLERAAAGAPDHPSIWLNLATSYRGLGLLEQEARALERTLAIEPRHFLALLQKGSLLELQGRPRAAAGAFQRALAGIPQGTQLAEVLRPAIERASEAILTNNAALGAALEERLRDVRARAAGANLERFDHCLDALLGRRAIYSSQPTFLRYPKLPAYEFHDRADFPWLSDLEATADQIRAECTALFSADPAAGTSTPGGLAQPFRAAVLWRQGKPFEANLARCPRTAELLARLPLFDAPEHGPMAFFSMLDAKTRIPPANGSTNARLIVHLPLTASPGCRLRVGSEARTWIPGQAWVFDDTVQHEAINESDGPLALLVFDIWNPALSAAERELLRVALGAYADYYGAEPGAQATAGA